MIKSVLLLIIFLFGLVPMILAQQTPSYPHGGGNLSNYKLGSGDWLDPDNPTSSSRLLVDGQQMPYAADLDNDGNNEIIVLDGTTIKIYAESSLDIVDALTIGGSWVEQTNLYIYDLDSDGLTDVLIGSANSTGTIALHQIEYNGATTTKTSRDIVSGGDHGSTGDMAIACRNPNDCLIIYTDLETSGSRTMHARWFNSTTTGAEASLDTVASSRFCLEKTRTIQVIDTTGDGNDDYIFTTSEENAGSLLVNIHEVEVSGTTASGNLIVDDFATGESSTDGACTLDYLKFSNPIAADFDGAPSNQEDFALGFNTGGQEFNINIYDNGGTLINNFPDTCAALPVDGDGDIISNLFVGSFLDSGSTDACIFGHKPDPSDPELEMVCANLVVSTSGCDQIFQYETPELIDFNITTNSDYWGHVVHAADYDNVPATSEIITAYGSFDAVDKGGFLFGELVRYYTLSGQDSAVVTVDAANDGSDDLLLLTSTQLTYVDDGLSNGPAELDDVTFNPCPIGTIIKQNSTMTIEFTVSDTNPSPLSQDEVSASVIMYEGSDNEFRIDSPNVTSGTSIPFSGIVLNKTVTLGTIKILARDTANPSQEDEVEYLFTVASTGIEFGDSQCTQAVTTSAEEEEAVAEAEIITETNQADNAIKNAIDTASDQSGLGSVVIFLLIIAIIYGTIFFTGAKEGYAMAGFVAANTVSFFGLIVGFFLGIVNIGIIITIIIVGLALLTPFIVRFTTGQGT